jgi:glycine cleavage system regulatory protein
MSTYLVLTVIGDDKPGLVEMLADTIARHSGNWLESNMSKLAGKFAGILRIGVDEQHVDNLITALDGHSLLLKLVVERSVTNPDRPDY